MTDIGARALALAEAEIKRLIAELAQTQRALEDAREALDRARRALSEERQALAVERQISNAARIYIMYTSGAWPGDENQIDLLTKWLEACKKRQGAE